MYHTHREMVAKEGVPPDKLEKKSVVKKNRSSCMFNLGQVVSWTML